MNAQKYTQKSLEAVQNAQSIATEYGNQQIEQPHLLLALLLDEGGLIPQLLGNMGLTVPSFTAAAKAEVEKLPRVSGSGREQGKIYVAQDVDKCLNTAESIAASMKDEYVSVEHLLLALLDTANRELKELFRTYNVQKEGVLQALTNVRGNQRVTSDNPEETYNALKKYGSDLVERARANKLDPVIGRDSEIRNIVRILSRKTKNNPVLIGEPGVGKTAAVEGLPYSEPQEQEQPGAHRRARRGQDRHRRGAGPAHRQGGRPRLPEGQDHFRPGYGFPDRRGQVPRRV